MAQLYEIHAQLSSWLSKEQKQGEENAAENRLFEHE